ncbi:MAG: bifunctional phosphopantothenoylcysteine decarboxylase/phosphopantothenate--cysteine ligase CoaBC [Gammaproteobacteria bacterium]|nr:bifunctional phosphopantothenoylcysteine decarboxylase/phosphopantothenate--cysteine ligase CoaBC [Gammaproteobacteria bacterium]
MQAKKILLAVSGGIAAYKTPELVRHLSRSGAEVVPLLTANAHRFVTPTALQAVAGRPALSDIWAAEAADGMGHIELARMADVLLVAPASANLMARMAWGMADDLVTATWLATRAPVFVAPAMNTQMWEHPATQRNVALLQEMGVSLIGPDVGEQACGEFGPGRMTAPAEIAGIVLGSIGVTNARTGALAGTRVLVTAGPTREPIDPVRFISNRSSGKQGFALAAAAQRAGADVTLVAGPVTLATPPGVKRIDVTTAAEMQRAVLAHLDVDILFAVAAVADYRPAEVVGQKIKKSRQDTAPTIALAENDDILACAAAANPDVFRVGFAAETENVLSHAREKRLRKNLDVIVLNDVSNSAIGFDSPENAVTVIHDGGETVFSQAPKDAIAAAVMDEVAELYAARNCQRSSSNPSGSASPVTRP